MQPAPGVAAAEALCTTQADLAHLARLATLGMVATSIAHEIKQPLAAIANDASACLRWLAGGNAEEARRSAEAVVAETHRASRIVSRILAHAARRPPLDEWVDVNDAIREVLAVAHGASDGKGVALHTRLAEPLPLVRADRVQFQRMVLNLIVNAIEAMTEMGEDVPHAWASDRREVLVTSASTDDEVIVSVLDSGPGLPPGDGGRLFDAFHSTKPRGLGVGLAISRSIVEGHRGRMWAAANSPQGAVFHFAMPIQGREEP